MNKRLLSMVLALVSLVANAEAAQDTSGLGGAGRSNPDDVFQFTNVWTIHLHFTPEQWQAMEPKQSRGIQRGGRRGSFLVPRCFQWNG